MKSLLLLIGFVSFLATVPSRAQFPNFPSADRVLGAPNFTTPGPARATPTGLHNPTGLAIDPRTGKLFVASSQQNRVLRFPSASSIANEADAEAVFGQINFSGTGSGSTATTLAGSYGIHVDGKGRLWVADFSNDRVLMFQGASTLPGFGSTADLVLGQPNFTTVTSGLSSVKMNGPVAVWVDAADNLWVADYFNHRVLRFANVSSLSNGAPATAALGQPDLTTGSSGVSAVKMNSPVSLCVDDAGRLWVAEESSNARVLRFDNAASLGSGSAASGVLGQTDFVTSGSGASAQKFSVPQGVLADAAGTVLVADSGNHRVLIFRNAAAKANGAAADGVIGQPDFTSNGTGLSAQRMNFPGIGLAFDDAGRFWISDRANNRALRFSPDRSVAPPRVTGKVPKTTRSGSVAVRGTASDPSGIAAVRFRTGKGPLRNAAGTTAWRLTAKLKPGKNTIQIVAVDGVGNISAPKSVRVVKR